MTKLELFIAGSATNSAKALTNLRRILQRLEAEVELAVVDVLSEPLRALDNNILVTPMLIRRHPEPTGMLLGSLDDEIQVAAFITTDG